MISKQKEILGILIVIIIAGIAGYLLLKDGNLNFTTQNMKVYQPMQSHNEEKPLTINNTDEFLRLNKDELLNKLFPSLHFKNGQTRTDISGIPVAFSLENSTEDYFINNKEKSLLLTVQLEGIPHAGGLYHTYLGLFDNNGSLLTLPINLESNNITEENGHFGGDEGSFGFYDCKGIKYILAITEGCPNGSCCSDSAGLYKASNGKFENVADGINIKVPASKNPWKITASGDKLVIKTVPETSDSGCPETAYKELKWNKNICKFE